MKLLAISGSLRSKSSNTNLVRALVDLAPPGVEVRLYAGLGELPHFNPDLDEEGMAPPPTVAALRREVAEAQALAISSPEYAHGIPGSLKNALDWLVSSEAVIDKPVALLRPAPRGDIMHAALSEVFRTMSMRVIEPASLVLPLGAKLESTECRNLLRGALEALVAAASHPQAG